MRSLLLTLGSLLLAASGAQAQFGVRAGLNTTTLTTKAVRTGQEASADARTSYQVGVFYEQKLSEHLAVVPELQFSRQSANLDIEDYSVADGGYAAMYKLQTSYLHLPVLLRGHVGRFFVEAGPQASLLVAAHEKGTETIGTFVGSYSQVFDRPATDQYRRFDVGVVAGLGVQLPAGLAVSVRASTGLLSLTSTQRSRPGYDGELRSQGLQASVSYQFGPRS
jgi:hypothetical protein